MGIAEDKAAEKEEGAAAPGGEGARAKPPGKGGTGLWPTRYELVDAWRGIAALLVVIHHVTSASLGWTVRLGGPAVMLFFVISGY